MKLCSVRDVKLLLDKNDTDHDSLLDKMVDFVSSMLEGAMNGRLLKSQQRIKYFNPSGRIYLLPAFPVDTASPFTVEVDGTSQVVNDDVFLYEDTGIVEFPVDNVWSDPKDVKITWTGGYTEGTGSGILAVPDDLSFACVLQTSFLFRRRKDLGTSYILMPDGAASIPTKEGLLSSVQDIVNRYALVYV
jgi:hypothetical protein